jgi:hypothetical protein
LKVYRKPPLLDGNLFVGFDKLLMGLVVIQTMLVRAPSLYATPHDPEPPPSAGQPCFAFESSPA